MRALLALDSERAKRGRRLADTQPHRVHLEFHGVHADVATNSTYLAEHVRLGYGRFESTERAGVGFRLLALEARADVLDSELAAVLPGLTLGNHIVMSLPGDLIYLLADRETAAYYTTMNLFGGVMRRLKSRFVSLHAATVVSGMRAVLLCGAARCGKTSVTVSLLARGYDYSSDDVTLVDRRTLRVAAFPRALNLRDESTEVAPSLMLAAKRVGYFRIADQERLMVDLGLPMPGEVEPKAVCFPRFDRSEKTRLVPLHAPEALMALMEHRFHPIGPNVDPFLAADFDVLGRLVEQCPCYLLHFSDPTTAGALLAAELLGEGG